MHACAHDGAGGWVSEVFVRTDARGACSHGVIECTMDAYPRGTGSNQANSKKQILFTVWLASFCTLLGIPLSCREIPICVDFSHIVMVCAHWNRALRHSSLPSVYSATESWPTSCGDALGFPSKSYCFCLFQFWILFTQRPSRRLFFLNFFKAVAL